MDIKRETLVPKCKKRRSIYIACKNQVDSEFKIFAEKLPSGKNSVKQLYSSGFISAKITSEGVCLTSSAASYLDDDKVAGYIHLSEGSYLRIVNSGSNFLRSSESLTRQSINVKIEKNAELIYTPKSAILQNKCNHHESLTIEHDLNSKFLVATNYVFGRQGEIPGTVSSKIKISCNNKNEINQERIINQSLVLKEFPEPIRVMGSVLIYDKDLEAHKKEYATTTKDSLIAFLDCFENAGEYLFFAKDTLCATYVLYEAIRVTLPRNMSGKIIDNLKFAFNP